MKTDKEQHVLTAIQADLLRELLKERCVILKTLDAAVKRQTFHAMRYHEKECYEQLLRTKRAYNILKTFLEVSSHETIDCS
jgi:hypothetical protein